MQTYALVATIFFALIITNNAVERAESLTPCMSNSTCSKHLPGSICIEDVCICKDERGCKASRISSKTNKIGGPCALSSDCLIDHAECSFSKLCVCVKGKKPSEDKRSCLDEPSGRSGFEPTPTEEPQGLESSCSDESKCALPFTECKDKVCKCRENYHASHGACIESKALGEDCTTSKECVALYSVCLEETCSCKKDYITHEAECLAPATNISSSCYEEIQCTKNLGKGSICQNQVCACRAGYEFKEDVARCVIISTLHSKCSKDKDCHINKNDASRLTCKNGECICKEPLEEKDDDCVCDSSSKISSSSLLIVCSSILLYVKLF